MCVGMLFEDVSEYYEKLEGTSSRLEMIEIMSQMLSKAGKSEVKNLIYMTQGMLAPPFEGLEIGIAEKLAEEAIALSTGAEKKSVDSRFKKTGDLGLAAEQCVKESRVRRISRAKFSVNDVFERMRSIATTSGEGSKDAKIKAMAGLLSASTPREARYIARFALGDLRLGAGDATILEALSKAYTGSRELKEELENAYNRCSDLGTVAEILAKSGEKGVRNFKAELFKPVRPALAERLPTAEAILEKMHGACAVESKYDGLRAQVHVKKGEKRVEIFSRRLERITEMFPDIVRATLSEIDCKEAMFEGEAISYDETTEEFRPFQETIQRKRKHGVEEKSEELPLHLFAFDVLYLNGEDCMSKPYEERRRLLEKIVKGRGLIRLSDMTVAKTPKELEKYFDSAVGSGLEGIVAKDLSAPYIAGARKFSWIKMKRSYKGSLSDTIDVAIVGYYRGRGQRTQFGFGGLLGAVYNEKKDVFETITRIGTGFTEQMMQDFRKLLEKTRSAKKPVRVEALVEPDFWVEPRYVVTVLADEITKSPMHTAGMHDENGVSVGYALRFPRIVRGGIRKDKSVEEATTTKEIEEMFKQQRKTKTEESSP